MCPKPVEPASSRGNEDYRPVIVVFAKSSDILICQENGVGIGPIPRPSRGMVHPDP